MSTKRVVSIVMIVLLSTMWVFPAGAAVTYIIQMLDDPRMVIDGKPIRYHVIMNLYFTLFSAGAVCAMWAGYLGYKHFPPPGEESK